METNEQTELTSKIESDYFAEGGEGVEKIQ